MCVSGVGEGNTSCKRTLSGSNMEAVKGRSWCLATAEHAEAGRMAGNPKFFPPRRLLSHENESSSLRKMTGTRSSACWGVRVTQRPENKKGRSNFAGRIL